jgi:hypothetical protein
MSRSKKEPIVKERPRNYKKSTIYWRKVRSVVKNTIKSFKEDWKDLEIPNPKTIVNDYDYSDYTLFLNDEKNKRK